MAHTCITEIFLQLLALTPSRLLLRPGRGGAGRRSGSTQRYTRVFRCLLYRSSSSGSTTIYESVSMLTISIKQLHRSFNHQYLNPWEAEWTSGIMLHHANHRSAPWIPRHSKSSSLAWSVDCGDGGPCHWHCALAIANRHDWGHDHDVWVLCGRAVGRWGTVAGDGVRSALHPPQKRD